MGKMMTLVEYLLLLYRALLPMPIWYCFFLNKEYGSLFSPLMTGLYLTVKLTSVVERVQSFFTAVKALSHKEVHYGAHATSKQEKPRLYAGSLYILLQVLNGRIDLIRYNRNLLLILTHSLLYLTFIQASSLVPFRRYLQNPPNC